MILAVILLEDRLVRVLPVELDHFSILSWGKCENLIQGLHVSERALGKEYGKKKEDRVAEERMCFETFVNRMLRSLIISMLWLELK